MKYTVKATYTGYMWIGEVYDAIGNIVGFVEPDGRYEFFTYTTK